MAGTVVCQNICAEHTEGFEYRLTFCKNQNTESTNGGKGLKSNIKSSDVKVTYTTENELGYFQMHLFQ